MFRVDQQRVRDAGREMSEGRRRKEEERRKEGRKEERIRVSKFHCI